MFQQKESLAVFYLSQMFISKFMLCCQLHRIFGASKKLGNANSNILCDIQNRFSAEQRAGFL